MTRTNEERRDRFGETLAGSIDRSLESALDNAGVMDWAVRDVILTHAREELLDDFAEFAAPTAPHGERERAVEAVGPYLNHFPSCPAQHSGWADCSCGLAATVTLLRAASPPSPTSTSSTDAGGEEP